MPGPEKVLSKITGRKGRTEGGKVEKERERRRGSGGRREERERKERGKRRERRAGGRNLILTTLFGNYPGW